MEKVNGTTLLKSRKQTFVDCFNIIIIAVAELQIKIPTDRLSENSRKRKKFDGMSV